MSDYAYCGLSREHLGEHVTELRRSGRRDASPDAASGAAATGGAKPALGRRWAKVRVSELTVTRFSWLPYHLSGAALRWCWGVERAYWSHAGADVLFKAPGATSRPLRDDFRV
jgi:hypothetical protein